MSKVIHFPVGKVQNQVPQVVCDKAANGDHEISVLSSPYHDRMFLKLLREWPCFYPLEDELNLQEILDLYYEDELTLSQDSALEYMFHMQDARSAFDIAHALYIWDEDDKNFFILSLNVHSELIKAVKKGE